MSSKSPNDLLMVLDAKYCGSNSASLPNSLGKSAKTMAALTASNMVIKKIKAAHLLALPAKYMASVLMAASNINSMANCIQAKAILGSLPYWNISALR